MSDQQLRELERAWRASGAPADLARLQRAQARASGVSPAARLALAAQLGDPWARGLLGFERPDRPSTRKRVHRFCRRLWRYGEVPCVLAAAAALRFTEPEEPFLQQALDYVDAWVVSPGHTQRAVVEARFPLDPSDRSAVAELLRALTGSVPRAQATHAARSVILSGEVGGDWIELFGAMRTELLEWALCGPGP